MSTPMSDKELYELAAKRVKDKKDFLVHLSVYIVVNIALIIIWALTGAGFPWFVFPLAGWGIGVIFHFLGVFVFDRGTKWERREIEKEYQRLKRDNQ